MVMIMSSLWMPWVLAVALQAVAPVAVASGERAAGTAVMEGTA